MYFLKYTVPVLDYRKAAWWPKVQFVASSCFYRHTFQLRKRMLWQLLSGRYWLF